MISCRFHSSTFCVHSMRVESYITATLVQTMYLLQVANNVCTKFQASPCHGRATRLNLPMCDMLQKRGTLTHAAFCHIPTSFLLTMIALHSTPQLMQLLQTPHTKSARTVQFRTCLVAQSWRLCQLCNRSSCQPQSCYFQKVRQHTPPIVHHGPGAATTTNMCAKHWLMRIVESFRQILGTVLCRTPLLGQSWSYHNSIPFHLIEQMQLLSVPSQNFTEESTCHQ